MAVSEMSRGYEGDPDSWEQVDINSGLLGGVLYVVIRSKAEPAFLTMWVERWFDDEEL